MTLLNFGCAIGWMKWGWGWIWH